MRIALTAFLAAMTIISCGRQARHAPGECVVDTFGYWYITEVTKSGYHARGLFVDGWGIAVPMNTLDEYDKAPCPPVHKLRAHPQN